MQVEALVQADARAQPSADFPASGRAEPDSRAHAHAPEACAPRGDLLCAVGDYQHALAWYRALRSVGVTCPVWRPHRLIGMGGDQVLTAVGGEDLERRVGDQAREQQGEEVDSLLEEIARRGTSSCGFLPRAANVGAGGGRRR